MEQGGVSSSVRSDICQEAVDGNVRVVGRHRLPVPVLVQVEVRSDGEDGERVAFVVGGVLRRVDFEETVGSVGVHGGTGDVDVRLLVHAIGFGRDELGRTKQEINCWAGQSICLRDR